MRIAALVPTRDRADTAIRAIETFLEALGKSCGAASLDLVVVDDSDCGIQRARLRSQLAKIAAAQRIAQICVVDGTVRAGKLPYEGGPGAARNCGLAYLRATSPLADVTIIFDDDVCFAKTQYRGISLVCDGAHVVQSALAVSQQKFAVAGCPYIGRQDLSILEHARASKDEGPVEPCKVAPSLDRDGIDEVGPGGISTAFLAIGAAPTLLPDFPEHYNEDYVWLHALAGAGWQLHRIPDALVHAPPGDVAVSTAGLMFQIHGEIVWLAVLERERYPVDDPVAMARAVVEIAGDLRSALQDCAVTRCAKTTAIIRHVLAAYEAVGRDLAASVTAPHARRLLSDVRAGLALKPLAR